MTPRQFTLKAELPVGRAFQQAFDGQVQKLRNAVIPLVAPHRGQPATVGSAVLLKLKDIRYLITANHVLEDHPGSLHYFGSSGIVTPLTGYFTIDKALDVAVTALSTTQIDELSRYPTLSENDIRPAPPQGNKQYAAVFGYPHTASKVLRGTTDVKTDMFSMANFVLKETDGKIFIKFDKRKNVTAGTRQQVTAPDPYGMSGGAIFAVPVSVVSIVPGGNVRLAGIGTHWRHGQKAFQGTAIEKVLQVIERA
ncbi:trypsin-like peptidase domain-containing protein [Bradyrhizobium sp. LMTR 3]|uniref:trypsin-like peptidase domain-containing protein n=1 Tax=Bradyrhizobium sp. LMTR 3 TaxID=189873 RepID=UPI001146D259|nr:trypsin-like peptidase domain-containing protein [Bradyrhizobium sp. LMTR 3]